MELDPQVPPFKTSDPSSFASVSVQMRWPTIMTQAIDDLHRTLAKETDETTVAEGKSIMEEMSKMKYELQHNRPITPILDDGEPDVKLYNDEIQARGPPVWHDTAWLFGECYLYRRLHTYFALSTKWKKYDLFFRQKMSTFKSSRSAVLELSAQYTKMIAELKQGPAKDLSKEEILKAERLLFMEMTEICLWGNATDLSLLTNLSYEDIQKLQGAKAREAAQANIVVNDLDAAYESLKKTQAERPTGERRVDIILDNAGFELYVDLILAAYLIESGLCTQIVLHPKSIPWFVSDVMPEDFTALLDALRDPQAFYSTPSEEDPVAKPLSGEEVSQLTGIFKHWSQLHNDGKLIIRPNRFWTHTGSYWRMPTRGPDVFADLRNSDMVMLKGDLNGRKLTGDAMWDTTTPFPQALGPLAEKGKGLRILSLRTVKADTVVGLPPGKDAELRKTPGGGGDAKREWAWTGKWAVCEFSDAK